VKGVRDVNGGVCTLVSLRWGGWVGLRRGLGLFVS